MPLISHGCLFPHPNGMEIHLCTTKTCLLFHPDSIVQANCPSRNESASFIATRMPNTTAYTQLVSSRCLINRTTEIFTWYPSIKNCISVQENETSHFYGSLYVLRQLAQTLKEDRVTAVSIREKPLVSLSVGMSALSVLLVLIMLLGVCNRNSSQRQRQMAAATAQIQRRAARRNRRRDDRDDHHHSIGTQAEPPIPSSYLDAPPAVEVTVTPRVRLTAIEGGLNEGFLDHEALINHNSTYDEDTECLSASLRFPRTADAPSSMVPSGTEIETSHSSDVVSPSHHKLLFKGVPWLPSYFDAKRTGMYCIVRESGIPPPGYDSTTEQTSDLINKIMQPTSWDLNAYGVHRGSTNSMPEISNIFDPPPSPYPGNTNQDS